MRLFKRLRAQLGLSPVEPPNDAKEARDGTNTAAAEPYLVPTESMCCGHCSGNADAHLPELPNAR